MHRLCRNYRNTIQIARFAEPIVRGLAIDDDATLPDFSRCEREGPLPIVLRGGFELQLRYAIDNIKAQVDLNRETVAFLHPLGWFSLHRTRLGQASLPFVEITKKSEWPEGTENIALCTLHSAKGLEFDHVIILGLNAEVLRHGVGDDDDRLTMLRRLLAMGIGRARKSVILGYKPDEASVLVGYFEPGTFNEVNL
jgi:superfamily I DNA/RNA helicase